MEQMRDDVVVDGMTQQGELTAVIAIDVHCVPSGMQPVVVADNGRARRVARGGRTVGHNGHPAHPDACIGACRSRRCAWESKLDEQVWNEIKHRQLKKQLIKGPVDFEHRLYTALLKYKI